MTATDRKRSEQDLDALLEQFFAAECPGRLPDLPPPPIIPRPTERRGAPRGVLTAAAAALLLAVVGLSSGRQPAERHTVQRPDWQYFVIEREQPLERISYETAAGPVEQRTDLRLTSVTVYEPETGTRVEWTVPEISIQVVDLVGAASAAP